MITAIFIVIILTLLNGFFAMSEIALVTVRKTRIKSLVKRGSRRARVVDLLQQNPENLFATIQIGISIVTIAASAFAGSNIASDMAALLARSGNAFIAANAGTISFVVVVALVSYVNITIGELIPKSIGLRYAESVAFLAAYPVWWLSRMSGWLVRILNASSNLFLKLFKDSTSFTEGRLSEEEIRSLISEGTKAGTILPLEHTLIENVFNISDLNVDKIMVPRTAITAFDIDEPKEDIVRKAIQSGYSRIPIYQGTLNNIVGVLYTKRLLPELGREIGDLALREFLVPPYFVPNTMKIGQALRRLQRKKAHLALVTDEHGEVEGLITLEDVLEEIVGDITDETDEADRRIKEVHDGQYIVDASIPIVDFNKHFKAELPEREDFNTLAGFLLEKLGRFPKIDDVLEVNGFKFVVGEATSRTINKVKIERVSAQLPSNE